MFAGMIEQEYSIDEKAIGNVMDVTFEGASHWSDILGYKNFSALGKVGSEEY